MENKNISRRELLKGTGALVVSFSLWSQASRAFAQSAVPTSAEPDATSLDSWLSIGSDGKVTLFTGKVDLGTGVETALSQIVAEELDVPFRQIEMQTGDTSQVIDQAATGGSSTVQKAGPQLRQAAAAARKELLKLASTNLQTPLEELTVTDGVVSVIGNPSMKVSYADLIGGKRFNVKITATGTGEALKVAPEVTPKNPKDYKIVGTSVPRVDLPPKFTGEFTYTADVRVPGMLHGRVVRPPTISTKPTNVDESSIENIAGMVKVVQQGCFVGVVAQTEWAAIQASRQLKVTWSAPEHQYPSSKEAIFVYLKNTKSVREQALVSRGDPEAAISRGSKTFEATYRWPFQLHGMLGPSCSVADVKENEATIWAGSQSTFRTREQLADLLGLPAKSVRVIYQEGSGSYGRLSIDDVALDAALMSRAVGRPVRVQWMRSDEHAWEPKGPAQLLTVRAAIDTSGKVTAWEFTDRSLPRSENGSPFLAARQIGRKPSDVINGNGAAGGGQLYTFENQKIVSATIPWMLPDPMPLRTCNLRAPGDLARTFASETLIDEMAMATGSDPVEFRLRYLNDNRVIGVLNAAAKQAQWTPRTSARSSANGTKATGRGVAVANRGDTMTACIAEVDVDKPKGSVQVKHITLAQDCGFIVNPDGVKNQVEGNVIQAVSRALLEEVKFDATGIATLDWESYPILRFPDAPEIDVVLVNQPAMPSLGTGEPGMVAVPAAIANAIADAIGVHLREVPMTPDRVLTALKSFSTPANTVEKARVG